MPPDQLPRDPSGDTHSGEALPSIARDHVRAAVSGEKAAAGSLVAVRPGGYLALQRGVFVTIRHVDGRLRGCKGTLRPAYRNLVEETRSSALSAAFHDVRCPPVTAPELGELRFEVSVLGALEPVAGPEQLDPLEFGVYLEASDGRKGLLLPGIEGLDTVQAQLAVLYRKAGIGPDEPVACALQRFRIDKFRGNACSGGGL